MDKGLLKESKDSNSVLENKLGIAPASVDEALLGVAINSSSCGITIADARQRDMPLVYVNETFEALTGYSASEVIGKNCRFLQGDSEQQAVHELKTKLKLAEKCTVTLLNYKKDGSAFYNELHLSPLYNENGVLTHFVGVQTDVTEKTLLQDELEAQKEGLEDAVRERTAELNAKNIALQEILSQIEVEKNKIKENIDANIEAVVLPLIRDLRRKLAPKDRVAIEHIEEHLGKLISPLGKKLSGRQYQLSRKEMEVCSLIAGGMSSKSIADFFSISPSTVENQRNNIRKKLGIAGKPINLEHYLLSFSEFSADSQRAHN